MYSTNYHTTDVYSIHENEGLLKSILYEYCGRDLERIFLTELQWLTPELALRFESNDINEAIQQSKDIDPSIEWEKMTVGEFVKKVGPSIFTGSCGNTSNVLEEILSGRVEPQLSKELPKGEPAELIEAFKMRMEENSPIYCRVETTGHSFIMEYYRGNFQIYQSFFGRHTLQKYLAHSQSWPKEIFLNLLTVALTSNPNRDDHTLVQSLLQLFHYRNVPCDKVVYRFIDPFKSPKEINASLKSYTEKHKQAWELAWDNPISQYVVKKEKFAPKSAEKIESEKAIRKLHPYFLDETLMPVDSNTLLEKGAIYYFKDTPYLLVKTELDAEREAMHHFIWIASFNRKEPTELMDLYGISKAQAENALELAQTLE